MARNVQTTTINLDMSATQARSALRALQTQAKQLERDLAACQDPNRAKRLQQELNRVNTLMRNMQTNARNAAQVLASLENATPNELRRTLSTLNRQMGNLRQGTEAYARTAADIRRVRDQLETVNASLSSQTSLWQRLKNAGAGTVAMVMGAVGTAQRMVAMAHENVEVFASMEGEMANVRKYSGMTQEQVEKLNEEFRKMDTRSSREDLNRLAQDAGRLGKQSVEDVLGFVRAADKINVALDDLGDGATLTLSKLAGLFGIEEKYGTEAGLLKVGSVINDLSQNCSASAPYIAEFTSRMGAAGVQAGMTVAQIMAYAAVMDECNVNVEASSTALSQLIIKLFKDPAKYAKAAGLDVKEFYATLKRDANEGFLSLIEALSKKGGLDKLAPIFAEMGANGSEAQKALGLLAQNIGKVRAQQEAANESFELGTSISEEFAVQNNTVAAGLDKARKEITETRVEIGQKLLPVVETSLSVTSAGMKVVSVLVSYLMQNIGAISGAAAAWALYKVAMAAANAETKIMIALQKGYALVSGVMKSATLLATAATASLTGNISRATAAMRLFRSTASLSSGVIGLVAAAIGLAVGALVTYVKRKEEAAKAEREHRAELDRLNSQLSETKRQAERDARAELNRAKDLYDAATRQTSAMNLRLEAASKLIALYPETFKNMTAEQVALGQARQ
ncbi:MAG: phage tail tape measure protein, partial [Muribaculaceae bacterium]|nr:phage tail tape measure protein [Muribaculaceae bacterium]